MFILLFQLGAPADLEISSVIQAKLDAVMADADERAARIVSQETKLAGSDAVKTEKQSFGRPSPTTLHRIMTMPKPMTHRIVHGALKAEIAQGNVTLLMREDPAFQEVVSDERFKRMVDGLIFQNCISLHKGVVCCDFLEKEMKAKLVEFSLDDYYTFDGTCNNRKLLYRRRGATPMPLRRLLAPEYDPPPSTPRQWGRNNQPLASARYVSNTMSYGREKRDPIFTMMGVTWGQFLDHDVDATCAGNFDAGQSCSSICQKTPTTRACLPIDVAADDTELTCRAGKCISFTRSCPACVRGGTLGSLRYRQQINQITSYIDAGTVYGGPDPDEPQFWMKLVDFSTGKMRVQKSTFNTDLLPQATVNVDSCEGGCFVAGDARANEVTGLTALHTIFLREHNRLVDQLKSVNPTWSPSKLYLEARKIVAAEIQHITYNEYVPLLLGGPLGRYAYCPQHDASTANVFATASFRYAHSSLTEKFTMMDSTYTDTTPLAMFDAFFDTTHIRQLATLDNILRGMSVQAAFKADSKFADSVRNRLFETGNNGCGLDLYALNIQRGRDHGLPPYNKWREFVQKACGVTSGRVSSFEDLKTEMSGKDLKALQSVYDHVDDIDLYVGGLAENLHGKATTGPTFWCLNKIQFTNFRHGDRLFYENSQVFSFDKIMEIKKVTLAKVICRNGDAIEKIPPQVMKFDRNARKDSCSDQPDFDVSPWQEFDCK
jgi:peroxidase